MLIIGGLPHLQSTGFEWTSRCTNTHRWKKHELMNWQVRFRYKSVRSALACLGTSVTATFGLTTAWESVMGHHLHSLIVIYIICFHSWHIMSHMYLLSTMVRKPMLPLHETQLMVFLWQLTWHVWGAAAFCWWCFSISPPGAISAKAPLWRCSVELRRDLKQHEESSWSAFAL